MSRLRLALVAGVVLVGVSGCGSAEGQRAEAAAEDFYAAVAARDGAAACALLAPATVSELEQSAQQRCAAAVLEEVQPDVGDAGAVQVYDTMAQVKYPQETVFLARMGDAWKVMAAVCSRPADARTYDCQVKGG